MSNRKKLPRDKRSPNHRGQANPDNRTPGPGESYVLVPALANNRHEPGIEMRLRKLTHDQLYRQVAEGQLVTGVWWTIHYGAEALDRYQRALAACGQPSATPEQAAERGVQLEGNPGLLCVIAWAIGRARPETP